MNNLPTLKRNMINYKKIKFVALEIREFSGLLRKPSITTVSNIILLCKKLLDLSDSDQIRLLVNEIKQEACMENPSILNFHKLVDELLECIEK